MHSSTSSSEDGVALPARSATRVLVAAVTLAGILMFGLELFWRSRGFTPMVRDTVQLWARERERVRNANNVIAIVGSSRAQLALDPQVLTAELGRQSVQLAITGGSSLPVLEDLAGDPRFRGIVLCEVTPSSFFIRPSTIPLQSGADWVAAARRLPLVSSFETRLRVWLQARTVLLLQHTNLRFQASALLTRRSLAPPSITHQRADRFHLADYSREDLPKMIAHWASGLRASTPPSDADRDGLIAQVRTWVEQIRARGGDVIFVRVVSSSAVLETEDEMWPRARYWDVFVRAFDNRAIYFADYPELARFHAPEGSHLDAPQAHAFTRALAGILRGRGWIGSIEARLPSSD